MTSMFSKFLNTIQSSTTWTTCSCDMNNIDTLNIFTYSNSDMFFWIELSFFKYFITKIREKFFVWEAFVMLCLTDKYVTTFRCFSYQFLTSMSVPELLFLQNINYNILHIYVLTFCECYSLHFALCGFVVT